MNTTTRPGGCGCGGRCGCTGTSGASEGGGIERPRFFPRQLVTPDDLTLGQEYLRNRLRRMNRYLHGWGVVCGAKVVTSAGARAWQVIVRPGYILGPFGDEIVLERDICFDLRTRCGGAAGMDACDDIVIDPLCPGRIMDTDTDGPATRYVAVRHAELPSRPVRVVPTGCGCDDTGCEYSRWLDSYEICVLDECPASHAESPPIDGLPDPGAIPDCPPCPTDPWVVLAAVTVDAAGKVTAIDNSGCRRMLAPFWRQSGERAAAVETPFSQAQPAGPAAPNP